MMSDVFREILDSLGSGVIAVDDEGVVTAVNPAARAHLRLSETELKQGVRIDGLPHLAPLAEVWNEVHAMCKPIARREILLSLGEETKKQIGLSVSLVSGNKPFNGAVFLFTDMTERRRQERSAELNRQLAALGELTAGVVHELRNPVSVISGMAELLMRKTDQNDDRHGTAKVIFNEAAALERSISQFLGFARPFELQMATCSVDDIVQRSVQLCRRRAMGKDVSVEAAVAPTLPLVRADVYRMAQALSNVLNNAIEAAPEGGFAIIEAYQQNDDIVFEIADNGPGIALGSGEDLFTPFFTKKEGGTGLGLSIAHRIVTAHKGTIQHTNQREGGARFVVRIPIKPDEATDVIF
ncbi:MAG: ATP-binding protein [Candidatus Hydrogenedentales bacterium]|jgi:signal transduction histidine kinase